jgi:hypothetical protein
VEILAQFLPVIVVQLATGPVIVQYFLLVETRYRLRKNCLFVCLHVVMTHASTRLRFLVVQNFRFLEKLSPVRWANSVCPDPGSVFITCRLVEYKIWIWILGIKFESWIRLINIFSHVVVFI